MTRHAHPSPEDDGWKTAGPPVEDPYRLWRDDVRRRLGPEPGRTSRLLAWLLLVPDLAHLAARFMMDPDVEKEEKVRFAGAVVQALIPALGPGRRAPRAVGVAASLAAVSLGLDTILRGAPAWVVQRHWAGDPETLRRVRSLLDTAGSWLPSLRAAAEGLRGISGRRRPR